MANLVEKLRMILATENVPQEKLVVGEVESFMQEHKGHGGYLLEVNYDKDNRLRDIALTCRADELAAEEDCLHQNPEVPPELRFSLVYSRNQVYELLVQEERRRAQYH